MGMAWGIGYNIVARLLEKERSSAQGLNLFFVGNFLASWMGAKFFFLVFSSGVDISKHAESANFWLGGGFIFYGGFLFALAFSFFYIFVLKKFDSRKIHVFFPAIAFGHGIGRLGCFLAGCCYGKITDSPLAVHIHSAYRHPVQLYEAILLFGLGTLLLFLIKKKQQGTRILLAYLGPYAFIRFFVEFFRGDEIRGLFYYALSTSQIISLAIMLVVLLFSGYEIVKGERVGGKTR